MNAYAYNFRPLKTPPELWKLQTRDKQIVLSSRRQYLLEDTAAMPEFLGQSCFGGRKDRLVVSSTVGTYHEVVFGHCVTLRLT